MQKLLLGREQNREYRERIQYDGSVNENINNNGEDSVRARAMLHKLQTRCSVS